jgi:hypothetical protein
MDRYKPKKKKNDFEHIFREAGNKAKSDNIL